MGPIHEWARPIYGSDYLLVVLSMDRSNMVPIHER